MSILINISTILNEVNILDYDVTTNEVYLDYHGKIGQPLGISREAELALNDPTCALRFTVISGQTKYYTFADVDDIGIHYAIYLRSIWCTRRIRRSWLTDDRYYRFGRTDVVATEPARTIELNQLRRSTIMAMPWPPPTHMDSMPTVLLVLCKPLMSVVMMRAPVIPNG